MMLDYEDPYSFLAVHLITSSTKAQLERLFVDDDYLKQLLRKEIRSQDFKGPFVDAIITDVLERKKRMEFMNALDSLIEYFWSQLDLERLRKKIIYECKIFSIIES